MERSPRPRVVLRGRNREAETSKGNSSEGEGSQAARQGAAKRAEGSRCSGHAKRIEQAPSVNDCCRACFNRFLYLVAFEGNWLKMGHLLKLFDCSCVEPCSPSGSGFVSPAVGVCLGALKLSSSPAGAVGRVTGFRVLAITRALLCANEGRPSFVYACGVQQCHTTSDAIPTSNRRPAMRGIGRHLASPKTYRPEQSMVPGRSSARRYARPGMGEESQK